MRSTNRRGGIRIPLPITTNRTARPYRRYVDNQDIYNPMELLLPDIRCTGCSKVLPMMQIVEYIQQGYTMGQLFDRNNTDISHRVRELDRLCCRQTVMSDQCIVYEQNKAQQSKETIDQLQIGLPIDQVEYISYTRPSLFGDQGMLGGAGYSLPLSTVDLNQGQSSIHQLVNDLDQLELPEEETLEYSSYDQIMDN